MVSMGTSLADRAWGRDSAVYRITGVLSVIGGWFITAGAAFTICFFVTMVIYFGGAVAIIALIAVAVYSLIHSQMMFKKRKQKKESLDTVRQMLQSQDNAEVLKLLRQHTREELNKVLAFAHRHLLPAREPAWTAPRERLGEVRKTTRQADETHRHTGHVPSGQ